MRRVRSWAAALAACTLGHAAFAQLNDTEQRIVAAVRRAYAAHHDARMGQILADTAYAKATENLTAAQDRLAASGYARARHAKNFRRGKCGL